MTAAARRRRRWYWYARRNDALVANQGPTAGFHHPMRTHRGYFLRVEGWPARAWRDLRRGQ